ncbi:MAG: ATP-dependent helicase HrpA [Naasia sp.]|uniref:ATP-dependent RNA helicase HrpA n=1 Tax=Naasia sp. TaxID=2546198 RepID=UPI00261DE81A|nr:ATP-dependent RNA helicase HrpA [Naasia sp.]MCU1569478.1 ATP-dependent helicase HrpA [Naasia sp.]
MTVLPRITYPAELPVSAMRDEIAAVLARSQVVIVAGATGSGKTTQLPKICLELGRESIAHTQPRRIAARTIAERIADELEVELGTLVGYQVRFTDKASASTRVKLMTDGILLNELGRDRMPRRYDTIILDEAHERSLNIDFLLGYLKRLLPQRPDLKVIVTSATIDPESFARHFASADGTPAPIVEVSGRTYPVEIRYRPLVSDGSDEDAHRPEDRDLFEGITDALDELAREAPGDVLVFLSGENEIRDAEEAVRSRAPSGTEVLPLYGRLSAADQHRVFDTSRAPGVRRRVVLATNVAETSITVPGIKYVIDGGTARISRYGARSKVQRLPIEPVSQASANQRAGRAGRTSDGIAIRLYSEDDYTRRSEFTDPEILRTGLAAVILQMLSLDLGDMAEFPFLQPPDSRGIRDGRELLRELGAVRDDGGLTKTGRDLARLPIDPRFGRMVLESKRNGVAREVLAIVAGLSIQDPRERPLEARDKADLAHARFAEPTSDFLSLLNLWHHIEDRQRELSSSAFRRLCRTEYLNYLRIREWQDVYRQLDRLAGQIGIRAGERKVDPDGIHRSLLSGLLSQIGVLDERSAAPAGKEKEKDKRRRSTEYLGARQVKFAIFPGSALAKKAPTAVMAGELVETSRLFARTVAAIDPAWAERLAEDLVKRSYSEPHWEAKQGAAVGFEKVTLYGVPLVARRRVQWSRVNPGVARELFLQHALLDGEWPPHLERSRDHDFDFERANARLLRELGDLEERTRRRDIVTGGDALLDFYESRIPPEIVTVRAFQAWWSETRKSTPELLTLTRDALLEEPESAEVDPLAFPTAWRQGDQRLTLRYRFEPGAEDDGVTVQLPLALLPRISPDGFDWLVPGLREDLVTALLRSLPKAIRRTVVPAGDWATRLLADLPADPEGSITAALARAIRAANGTAVTAEDFDLARLPPHLRMTFAVVDERGTRIGFGKDLGELQERFADQARESVSRLFAGPRPPARKAGPPPPASTGGARFTERSGITSWDFAEVAQQLDVRGAGGLVRAYPALVDEGESVALRLFGTPAEQAAAQRAGVRRLLHLATPSPVAYLNEHLTAREKLALATSPYRSVRALFDDALQAGIEARVRGLFPDGLLWTREDFDRARDEVSAHVLEDLFGTVALLARILPAAREAEAAVKAATSMALLPALTDARAQLAALVHPGFVSATGLPQLGRLPVYLAGVTHRIAKLRENPNRDRVWMNEVQTATERYLAAGGTLPLQPDADPRLAAVRWMLEELRISLFAQPLGAQGPISAQRITRALAELPTSAATPR